MTDGSLRQQPHQPPFWRKPLESLSREEWESLCDGCGRCCLLKLEDEDTGDIYFTNVSCRLLKRDCGRCSNYADRLKYVPDCVQLSPENVRKLNFLPPTCTYRLVANGEDPPSWHPLMSGRAESVIEVGVSIVGRRIVTEDQVDVEDLPSHIVSWPARYPKAAKSDDGPGGSRKIPL